MAVSEQFGGLTTLVNNAGIFHPGGVVERDSRRLGAR